VGEQTPSLLETGTTYDTNHLAILGQTRFELCFFHLKTGDWGGRTCYPVTHVLQTGDNLNVKSSQILVKRRDKAIGHDYNKFHKPFQTIFENSTSST
jgi:hypothetical protein